MASFLLSLEENRKEIMERKDIKSLNQKELIDEMVQLGEKAFRGKQLYE